MRMPVAIVLALTAAIMTAFASDYAVKEVKLLPIDSYPARVTVGDITIAADPYATDEKSYTAFDYKNLNTRGYHPVHVIIQNATSDYITIRTRYIVLRDTDGSELYATSAAVLVSDLFKGNLSYQRGSPFMDFSGKELPNSRIDPKGTVDGFLFFFMPQEKGTALAGTQLVIPEVINDSTRKPIGPFVIPLDPGIRQGEEQKSK